MAPINEDKVSKLALGMVFARAFLSLLILFPAALAVTVNISK